MICRLMTLDDLDTIMQIEHEAFTIPWSRQSFTEELTRNACARYLVIEQGGELAGYGGMWFVLDECHVTNIAIRADMRGRGLGEQLLRDMQQFAADSGMAFMTLEVRRSNTVAQNLYHKLGFIDVGYRKRYYEDNHEDALIMTTLSLPEPHPDDDPFIVNEAGETNEANATEQ